MKKSIATFFTFAILLFGSQLQAAPVPFKALFAGKTICVPASTFTSAGEGLMSHGGASTTTAEALIVGEANCSNEFAVINNQELTSASGDKIFVEIHNDYCCLENGIYEGNGVYSIKGGTGKFTHATGAGIFSGMNDFSAKTFIFDLKGTIDY